MAAEMHDKFSTTKPTKRTKVELLAPAPRAKPACAYHLLRGSRKLYQA